MKRDYFGLKGAPTSPNGNRNLGQDLGNIRAKLKNRISDDSFGKHALTNRPRGRTRRGSRPSAPRAPDGQELLAPLAADGLPVEAGKFLQGVGDRLSGRSDRGCRVAVGAAGRLGHDLIDDTEAHHVVGGELYARRRILRIGRVAPQETGGAPP